MFKWPVIIGMSACLGLSSLLSAASAETTRREFLWHGKTLEDAAKHLSSERLRAYHAAVERYLEHPCAIPDEAARLVIEWSQVKTNEEMEVCLFQLADSLRSADSLSRSLLASGFKNPQIIHSPPSTGKSFGLDGRSLAINASVPRAEYPRWFGASPMLFSHSLSISVIVDETGIPYSANAAFIYM